jgi:hypothetical protein
MSGSGCHKGVDTGSVSAAAGRDGGGTGQCPMAAAAAHAAAPTASAQRGLVSWDTAPMIGDPIGVLPTRARDHKAVTRPR